MNIVRINSDIKEFSGILHIADIHIRLTKRHDEYSSVFSKLYDVAKRMPINSCIAVLGDVFHSKSDLSPECVKLAGDFLKNLADIRPTVVISGNHDATLSNKNRLDSLSPIVDALNHPNLFYLKNTGLYILGDILFNHMSVFDESSDYIKAEDIPKIYLNETRHLIGLFHGPVNEAMTDVGYTVSNRSITTSLFNGHDITLLGDIHKYQVLTTNCSKKSSIVYCGSIIQQNHGEDLNGHGCVVWNLKQRTFKQLNLPNDYGFFTIDINKGKLITDISNLPKKVRLRVRCFESVASEVKSVISEIRLTSDVIEITYVRVDSTDSTSVKTIDTKDLNLSDIGSIDYQNKLIKDFISGKVSDVVISDELYERIFEINKFHNQSIDNDKLVKNIRWKPKKFEFSNMFSYGEDNVIDFTDMRGVVGLFALNASGKSSLLSALSFCIFDKCDRAFKASHVLNSQKMTFSCKFNFEIDKIDYFIERVGKSDKKGNVKVDVKFWREENGKTTELNGEARRSTNDLIRDHVGSYDDFILTVLSIQNNKAGSFIDMGQTERKDLLSQFMGLNIFDILYQTSSEKMKEISSEIKTYYKNETSDTIDNLTIKIESLKKNCLKLNEEYDSLICEKETFNGFLMEENRKLVKLEKDVPTDIVKLAREQEDVERFINKNVDELSALTISTKKLELTLSESSSLFVKFDKEELSTKYTELKNLKDSLLSVKHDVDKKKIFISAKLEKINKLKTHEYDPNCKYCVNNEFVKDAMVAQSSLDSDKDVASKLVKNYEVLNAKIKELYHVEDEYTTCQKLDTDIKVLEKKMVDANRDTLILENTINTSNVALLKILDLVKLYHQRKTDIENNISVEGNINNISSKIKILDVSIKNKNNEIISEFSKVTYLEKDKVDKELSIKKIKELESELIAYKYYVDSVSRDGIPFELISKAVPVLEKEVNHILTQIVEFSINIQTDGKNVITNLVYNDKKWPLELSSGLEKFLTSLVLRVALINISNLPRPNFIAIDEGFGCADADNLSSMSALFSILKNSFDFMLIISHLDSMKDMVDSHIEIKKENGFSKIDN